MKCYVCDTPWIVRLKFDNKFEPPVCRCELEDHNDEFIERLRALNREV